MSFPAVFRFKRSALKDSLKSFMCSIWLIHIRDRIWLQLVLKWGFLGGSEVKVSACSVGDLGSIPGSGRSPGEGNGNPLQCSWLENLVDRGAWWATVHGVTESWTQLSDFTLTSVLK